MVSNSEIKKISKKLISNGKWFKFGLIAVFLEILILGSDFFLQNQFNSYSVDLFWGTASSSAIGYILGSIFFIIFISMSMKILLGKVYEHDVFRVKTNIFIKNLIFKIIFDFIGILVFTVVTLIIFPLVLASFIGSGNTFEVFGMLLDVETTIVILLGFIVLITVVMFVEYMYFLTFYLNMIEDNDNGIFANMKLSRKMMRGNKLKLFTLNLSFIFWLIFSCFTVGLLLIYAIPYIYVANAVFFQEVINENREILEEFNLIKNTGIQKVIESSSYNQGLLDEEILEEDLEEKVISPSDMESKDIESGEVVSEDMEDTVSEKTEDELYEKDFVEEIIDEEEASEESDIEIKVTEELIVVESEEIKNSDESSYVSDKFEKENEEFEKVDNSEFDFIDNDINSNIKNKTTGEEAVENNDFYKLFYEEKVEEPKEEEIDIFSEIAKELESK